MEHVARRGVDFCPRVAATLSGETIARTEDGAHFVRCITYLPGNPLAEVRRPNQCALLRYNDLLTNLGRAVGALDAALADFDHPAVHREFYWDLAQAERVVGEYLPLVAPIGYRRVIERVSDVSLSFVDRHLAALRRTTVHHDANDWNVLVDGPRISGIIDFGDIVHSWTVADPAVAIAYAMLDSADPLAAAVTMVGGYHERRPMDDAEIACVFPFSALRLCMSACIAASQQHQRAGDPYLGISQASIERMLPLVAEIPPARARDRLWRACR